MTETFDNTKFLDAQNIRDNFVRRSERDQTTVDYFVAVLLNDGILTDACIKRAEKLMAAKNAQEDAKQKIVAAQIQVQVNGENCIDAKFPRLFCRRSTNLNELAAYIKTVKTLEIEQMLTQLRERTEHYRSLYHGQIVEAVKFLENELRERKGGN
jgi:hypothetical protein